MEVGTDDGVDVCDGLPVGVSVLEGEPPSDSVAVEEVVGVEVIEAVGVVEGVQVEDGVGSVYTHSNGVAKEGVAALPFHKPIVANT